MNPPPIPQAVLVAIVALNRPLEGSVSWLYKDSKNFPTIGVGLLVPDLEAFLRLPMVRKDNRGAATDAEKLQDWSAVAFCKNGQEAAAHVTQLELTGTSIVDIANTKIAQNHYAIERELGADFVAALPWDMMVCLHSMAYAMGSGFFHKFPKFTAALRRGDYLTDEVESDMPEGEDGRNPNLHPRNVADGLLCHNAAEVVSQGLDPKAVYWPEDLRKRRLVDDTERGCVIPSGGA